MQHAYMQDPSSSGSDKEPITNESYYHQLTNKLNCNMTSSVYYNFNNQLQEQNFASNDPKDFKPTKVDKMAYSIHQQQTTYPSNPSDNLQYSMGFDAINSYNLNQEAQYYHQDLVYSQILPPMINLHTKKLPFQFNEDQQASHFNQLQADKLFASQSDVVDAKNIKINEALKAFHDIDIEDDSEDEGIEDYKLGGYHPVHVGETLHKRYVTVQKLGWGHFSTVWLCKDFKFDTYVAVKIQKSAEHYIEAAYDEVEILQKVANKFNDSQWIQSLLQYKKGESNGKKQTVTQNDAHVVQLLNSFVHKAPYGNHFCMVFEILGVNLLEIIKRYEFKGIPLNLCKKIAKQTLIGLDFLHRVCGVIHTDLKPENVLLQLTQEEITEIIMNGQLRKTQLFNDRLQLYHDMFNIPKDHDLIQEIVPLETSLPAQSEPEKIVLTKTQKKNLKKRLQKKNKNLNNQNDQESASTNQSAQIDENMSIEQLPDQKSYKDLFSLNREKISFKRDGNLPSNFQIKVADLGNACWTHHHFSSLIQTRQYRSPETIIGATYNQTSDIWSFACMLFELLTGDFLFEPRKGAHFSKNDDHLAQMQELVGKFPLKYSQSCAKAKRYFSKNGSLVRIPIMNCWSLKNVLIEKYRFKLEEATQLASFFQNMLNPVPEKRAKADEQLLHKWLEVQGNDNYTGKMDDEDFKNWQVQKENLIQNEQYLPHPRNKIYESEEEDGDVSDRGTPLERTGNWRKYQVNQQRPRPQVVPRIAEMCTIDRSFTDLGYIGFETGIDAGQLDKASNQQFIN